jgi:hypothetical protein
MYLYRSRTGNIFPSWTIVVWRHHVYVREFHRPSCNSAPMHSLTVQRDGTKKAQASSGVISLAIIKALYQVYPSHIPSLKPRIAHERYVQN